MDFENKGTEMWPKLIDLFWQILAFDLKLWFLQSLETNDFIVILYFYIHLSITLSVFLQHPGNAPNPCGYMCADGLLNHNCQLCHL